MTSTLDLVYINAGGGHRASALALEAIALEQRRPWNIRLVNLFEVLDPAHRFESLTGFKPEDMYNKRLARGWTRSMGQELKVLQQLIRLSHPRLVQRLCAHWQASPADMVVSLIPNFNRAMLEGLRRSGSQAPYVTVMTDLADLARGHFWIEAAQAGNPQHLVCGTDRAVQQALALGHGADYVHATSGMLVRPEFYGHSVREREPLMRHYGLDPQRPTGLVLFGGHGSRAMLDVARKLPEVQLILLCGHNQALAEALRKLPAQAPRLVQGFTSDVPGFMRMADFFIGKPGPGSISEALCSGLPVMVLHGSNTMPQERYNVQWVVEQGVGLVCKGQRGIATAVQAMLAQLPVLRQRVAAMNNRALFEVPQILAQILQQTRPAPAPAYAQAAVEWVDTALH